MSSNFREFVNDLENEGELHRVTEEVDPVLEITEIAIPHNTRKAPYPVVMIGIDWPPTVNCSLMFTRYRSSL